MSTDVHHGLYCENVGWEFYYSSSSTHVGLRTSTTPYPISMEGDSYTTGWSRAASGFYVEGSGVHFTNQGYIGEIDITENNEFLWGSRASNLYFNYRPVTRGTTVTDYIWNAGSSSSYASHTLGNLYVKNVTLSTTLPTYDNAPVQFNATTNNNDASNSRYQPWISGKDSVNSYGHGVTISTGIYRDPGYANGGYYIGCGWDGNANSVMWKFNRNSGTIVPGPIYMTQLANSRQAGIIGTYDPNRAAAIWSMGADYQIAADGTTFGNLYGAAYAYFGSGHTFGANYSLSHSFVWCLNGTPYAALGYNIWTRGSLIADCDGYGTVKIYGTSGGSRIIEDLGTTNGFYIKTSAS